MAIAAWLEMRDSERRISFDPLSHEADRMRQVMAFINTGFTGVFGPLWVAMEMRSANPAMQSALKEWGCKGVVECHERLEEMIDDTRFLIADHPTLADGILIGVARWLDFHQVADKGRWPKLAALRGRIDVDPAVIYAILLENGEMQPGNGACRGHVELTEVIDRFGSK